jgi:hypothetical protein
VLVPYEHHLRTEGASPSPFHFDGAGHSPMKKVKTGDG